MNEMTLPYRNRIQNSGPGGLRPSTLPVGHGGSPQFWVFTSERWRNFLFLWTWRPEWGFETAISHFPSRQSYPLLQGPRPESHLQHNKMPFMLERQPFWIWSVPFSNSSGKFIGRTCGPSFRTAKVWNISKTWGTRTVLVPCFRMQSEAV